MKLVDPAGILGASDRSVKNDNCRNNPNCFVRKSAVASGITRKVAPYMCSNSCTAIFETAEVEDEWVMAACAEFFPVVFEYNAMTVT